MLPHVTFRHQSEPPPEEPDTRATYWIIPGGLKFEVTPGNLTLRGEADGFHKHARMGDPMYLANGYISMPWAVQNDVEPDWIHSGFFKDSGVQNEGGAFFMGPWGGFAGEMASVQVESRRETLPGYIFPNISFSGAGGGWVDEEPYGQQSLDQLYPIEGSFQEGWQNWFAAGMTYDQGMIATRLVAYMFGAHSDPAYTQSTVGACYDGVTFRRLPTLTPAQITQLAEDAGVLPDADEAIPGAGPAIDETWSFELIKPIGIVDDTRVRVTCVGNYSGKYTRRPLPAEWPYYTRGRAGYDATSYRWSHPLLDAQMVWHWGSSPSTYAQRGPLAFEETASAMIFFTAVVGPFGFEEITPTGVAESNSSVARPHSDFMDTLATHFTVFKRIDGSAYDVVWEGANIGVGYHTPQINFGTGYEYKTPNGWTMRVRLPVSSFNPVTRHPGYCIVPCFPNSVNYGATPPPKPSGAPADWTPPPFDPPADLWLGFRFRDLRDGSEMYANVGNTFSPYAVQGGLCTTHGLYPTSDAYRRPGTNQYPGVGTFQVSPFGAKSVSTIKATVGSLQRSIADPGGNPVMRYFEGPNGYALRKTQFGQWEIRQGVIWYQSTIDFGEVRGTLSVIHKFEPPTAP